MSVPAAAGWWGHFTEAVVGVFREWTALRLAASSAMGQGDAEKINEMAQGVLEGFAQRCVYKDELEDYFDDYFQNEFAVIVEDGSIEEVSELLQQLYEECRAGDFRRAMMLAARSRSTAEAALAASHAATAPTEMAPAYISENRMQCAAEAMASVRPEDLCEGGAFVDEGAAFGGAPAGQQPAYMAGGAPAAPAAAAAPELTVPEFDLTQQLTPEEAHERAEKRKRRAAARRAARDASTAVDSDGFRRVR